MIRGTEVFLPSRFEIFPFWSRCNFLLALFNISSPCQVWPAMGGILYRKHVLPDASNWKFSFCILYFYLAKISYRKHVLPGSKSMQVKGSCGRPRYIGDAISILWQFNLSKRQKQHKVKNVENFLKISFWVTVQPSTPHDIYLSNLTQINQNLHPHEWSRETWFHFLEFPRGWLAGLVFWCQGVVKDLRLS